MKIADLHIHSRYSSGSSKYMTVDNIVHTAQSLYIDYLGTGDILHTTWEREIKLKCDVKDDFYVFENITLIPSVEVECAWVDGSGVKRGHILLLMTVEDVKEVRKLLRNEVVDKTEGRVRVSLSPYELRQRLSSLPNVLFIPAHILTPWFGLMGWRCGWGKIQILELRPDAIETGLSASPDMLRTILSSYPYVSFSDAHSPQSIGREVTIIPDDTHPLTAIRSNHIFTLEHPPQTGKYYETGCRRCGTVGKGRCECGKTMTVGTLKMMRRLNENGDWQRHRDIYVFDFQTIRKHADDTITNYHDLIYTPIDDTNVNTYLSRMFEGKWKRVEYGFDGKFGKVEV